MTRALKTIYTIWLREAKTFWREKARIVAMIGQPLLYLLILGNGITAGMRLNRAGAVGYIQFLYPGVIAMSILFTSIFSALSIIWDREFGFLKEVLVAPVPRWAVAMGKAFGGATIAMVQAIIMIVMAPLVGITLSIMIIAKLLVLAFLMSFAVTSLGIVIASRMASMQSFQMVMNFLVLPIFFLSGALFPLDNLPKVLSALTAVDPLSYGVDGLRAALIDRTHFGAATDAAVLGVFALVVFCLGAWRFSKIEI